MRRITLALMLLAAGCRQGSVSGVELEPLGVSTEPLAFDDTFIGFSTQRARTITVPGKASREVRITVTGPFEAPAQVQLPGSESADLTITFRPIATGATEGTLELFDVALGQTFSFSLSGRGLAVPDCRASTPCVTSRFELSARGCVEAPVPDDTPCTSSLSCFSRASCVAGVCKGTTVTCDDGDPCTLDVCSDLGCGQVDGTPYCPGSENPCLVPTCSRDAGCGLAEVPDGTACGERSCTTALICISGTCVQRTPPRSQACADVLVGVPAGRGFVDGRGDDVRFNRVQTIAVQGEDLLLVDDARVRHLRRGNVTTIAGRSPPAGIIDGIGTNASLGSFTTFLAPTTTPGLFFLGDGPTIRLVSTRGVVTTLAGKPDAGGALDGIGAAARLSVNSPLTAGGAGARWVQVPRDTTALSPLLVREVSNTGTVRTLQSFDLSQLPAFDAGTGARWFISSSGVAPQEPLTAWVTLNDPSRTSYGYRLTWTDGGVVVAAASEYMQWSSATATITHDACRVRFEGDAGLAIVLAPACISAAAFDGDQSLYVGSGEVVLSVTPSGAQVVAGPLSDRRIVDGDRDAGRTLSPRNLSLAPDGIFFLDSTPSLSRARLLRLNPNGTRGTLETVDAGLTFQSSLTFHQGQLWLYRDDSLGLITVIEPSGALVRRFSSVPNLGQVQSNGSVLRAGQFWFHELSADGGVRRIPGLTNVQSAAPGPAGVWYVFAARDPNDGGFAEPRQLFRVEADESFAPVAGDVTKTTDSDGPALTAGITIMQRLTVAPDGTVSFLGAKNQLRQLRNGQVTTLMTLSDTPLDLVALSDGSLVVAVDAAFLRVFP